MDIGEKLRQIRLLQGKTQKEMNGNYFDRSFYSRIENGENNIAAKDLIKILQKNNISVVDFLCDYGDIRPKEQIYQRRIENAYALKDIDKLKEIQNDTKYTNQIVKSIIELMIAKLENKSEKYPKLRRTFKKYIYNLNKGDESSLWILEYSMFIYNFSDLEGIIDSIFNKYQNTKLMSDKVIQLLAKISTNYLNICLQQKKGGIQIKKTLNFIDKLPSIDEIAIYKICSAFYRAMLSKKNEDCKNILDVLNECGCNNESIIYLMNNGQYLNNVII